MSLFSWSTGDRITATRLNGAYNLFKGVAGGTDTLTLISGSTLDMSACAVASGFKPPAAAGAAPTTEGVLAYDTTADTPAWGDGSATRKAVSLDQTQTLSNKTLDASCKVTAGGVSPSSPDFWILS